METIKNQTETKAIKNHVCDLCSMKIRKGEKYYHGVYKYDDIYSFKSHKNCHKLAVVMNMYKDSVEDGLDGSGFQETIESWHYDYFYNMKLDIDPNIFSEILCQIRRVQWNEKLNFVIRKFMDQILELK